MTQEANPKIILPLQFRLSPDIKKRANFLAVTVVSNNGADRPAIEGLTGIAKI